MKKRSTRMLSLFLCALMLFMLCPVPAQASSVAAGTGVSVTQSAPTGVGTLKDTGITDVYVEDNTVTVEYHSAQAAELYVQILEDTGSGAGEVLLEKSISVAATDTDGTTKSIAFASLPQYFVIRAWLASDISSSLTFETFYYTEEIQTLADSLPSDNDPLRTVELWGEGDTGGYVVLPEGGHIFRSSSGYALSAAEDGVTFSIVGESEAAFVGVKKGDVICHIEMEGRSYRQNAFDGYNNAGEPYQSERFYEYTFLKVKTVKISGNRMTITSNLDEIKDTAELFETVCLRGAPEGAVNKIDKKGSFSFSRDLHKGINGKFEFTGKLKGKVSYEVYITLTKRCLRFVIEYSIEDITLALETSFNVTADICSLDFPIVPPEILNLGIGLSLSLDCSACGKLLFQFYGQIGFSIENTEGHDLSKKPTFTYDTTELEGDIYVSIGLGPELNLVKIFKVGFSVNFGVNFHLSLTGDEGGIPNKETWHACHTLECLGLHITFKIAMGFYLKLVIKTYNFPVASWDWPITDFYHSKTFDDGGNSTCPHIGYRVKVTALHKDTRTVPVKDVMISYDVTPHEYDSKARDITDKAGEAFLFVPNGSYTLRGVRKLPNGENQPVTADFTVQDKAQEITLYFDDTAYTVNFDRNTSGTVSNMPDPIEGYAGIEYKLPSEVPVCTGLQFIGWAETQDGPAKYLPGDEYTVTGNATLYAHWELAAGSTWTLVFHPNGNGQAPLAVTEDRANPILIPTEEPVWEGYTFMGWARSPEGPADPALVPGAEVRCESDQYVYVILYAIWEPDLTLNANAAGSATGLPGDVQTYTMHMAPGTGYTLSYDLLASGRVFLGWSEQADATEPDYAPDASITMPKTPLTLYGVWNTSSMGYFIFYDANGGTDAPIVTVGEAGSPVYLSALIPVREGYIFCGWATDPNAEMPEYLAGDIYKDMQTMTLYAVWTFKPGVACYITYDAAGGTGAPEPQLFAAGEKVRISEKIPSQVAHKFKYWEYQVGSLIRHVSPAGTITSDRDITLTAAWATDYRITSGNGSTYVLGSRKGLTFVCNGALERFDWLGIDSNKVDESNYTVKSGSTILTLKPSFLNELEEGEHTIVFIYDDGQTSLGRFNIRKVPPTGDTAQPVLFAVLAAVSLAALALLLRKKRTV